MGEYFEGFSDERDDIRVSKSTRPGYTCGESLEQVCKIILVWDAIWLSVREFRIPTARVLKWTRETNSGLALTAWRFNPGTIMNALVSMGLVQIVSPSDAYVYLQINFEPRLGGLGDQRQQFTFVTA